MKALMIFLLMLGGICHAQKVKINGVIYFEETPETYLSKRIDSLEKRVVSLEKMVKVLYDKHIQDSLYYQRLVQPVYRWPEFPQLDSIQHYPLSDTAIIWNPNLLWEVTDEFYLKGKNMKRKSR